VAIPETRGAGQLFEAPKLARVVAHRLEDEIVERGWPVGEVIGSETELLQRFGVSRAVLREAVRLVEHTGAARMRRGPGGGLVVAEPNRDAVVRAMGIWFSFVGVTLAEMLEARLPVLVELSRLAAGRVDDSMAARARTAAAEIAAADEPLARRLGAIDALVAGIGGNPALSLVREGVSQLGIRRLRSGRSWFEPAFTAAEEAAVMAAHVELVDAVVRGDDDRAADILTGHTELLLARLREGGARRDGRRAAPAAGGKLAERVAEAMHHDIERRGWPVGDVLGSEADLIERYGVSRAILREAVRIVEHHGAIRTKRGPRGGFVVQAPDRSALVRAARLVLEYEGVTVPQLLEARGVLDVAAAREAAIACTAADAERLRRVITAEERSGDAAVSFDALHDAVATTAGNRVFVLFVDLMATLARSHLTLDDRDRAGLAELSVEVHRAHERIAEAIIAGDAVLAEQRMARHVRASGAVLH
jgi:DNA-binding FadR family transcriptional regulator